MAQRANVPSLPPSFSTIRDILNGKHAESSLVNVAGLVMDYRTPIKTRGTDYKCEIRLFDQSVENQDESICLNIFRPCDEIPLAGCGDVVLLFRVKVQCRPDVSLVTNRYSDIYSFDASAIPKPPADASRALRCMNTKKHHTLTPAETTFVSSLYHRTDKSRVPTKLEFAEKVTMSANVKEKVKLLRDVSDSTFADIIGRIVKEPYDDNERITLWISDYTENAAFFNFPYKGDDTKGDAAWTGPFGKRSIQITCFEPHASFIQSSKLSDCWVHLRNVHIKYGRNGKNLEGFLRGDRTLGQGQRTRVQRLDHLQDREALDPRLVDAIRRKRDYERSQTRQIEEITEAATAGQRRRAALAPDAEPPAKKKPLGRKRAAKQKAAEQEASAAEAVPDINSQIKCEHMDKQASLVSDMLKTPTLKTSIDGTDVALELPFTNHNYRANTHVVDFAPCDLRRFARPVHPRADEYQALSDNASVSSSSSSSSSSSPTSRAAPTSWEWRFFLKLQDATPSPSPPHSVWVLVDNQAAQCLINLDATDLKRHPIALNTLRERLFILWGDLEEHKRRARNDATATRRPPDSDDEQPKPSRAPKVLNRPFACCVCQFGVRVRERDEARANAGPRKRWQRVFALFGTKIMA
ncbi:hypothetical protein CDD82_5175 [Ophiocordyceps australis]|uniref:Protection of telomeres protein 1 n=1 Tax=Ophiocordyceps australis TaxID=1399860 RepID=A0A2C5XIU0_9HYPO|nr:hypothetical protein CDD82_5175 [Ophiocordyceps australis]